MRQCLQFWGHTILRIQSTMSEWGEKVETCSYSLIYLSILGKNVPSGVIWECLWIDLTIDTFTMYQTVWYYQTLNSGLEFKFFPFFSSYHWFSIRYSMHVLSIFSFYVKITWLVAPPLSGHQISHCPAPLATQDLISFRAFQKGEQKVIVVPFCGHLSQFHPFSFCLFNLAREQHNVRWTFI